MGLRLNRIEEAVARETLGDTEERVNRLRKRIKTDPEPKPDRHYYLGGAALDFGLEYYQQEKPVTEILPILAEAADAILRSWELRTKNQGDGITDAVMWPRMISPVIAFGPVSIRDRLVAIPDTVIYEDGPTGTSAALLIAMIRHWLRAGELGEPHAAALERYSRDNATRRECKVLLPTVQGLEAVAKKDADAWNASLAATTADHKRDAMRGELQRDPRGYMNLEGVWLLRLGLERGMSCTVDSPYLPIFILEAACRRFASSS